MSLLCGLKRTFFLVCLTNFALFAPPSIVSSEDVDRKPSIRVIYGGSLFGTLKPCG